MDPEDIDSALERFEELLMAPHLDMPAFLIIPSQGTLAALGQAGAAADRAASPARFAAYRRQLAARTRSTHDQDLARCAL